MSRRWCWAQPAWHTRFVSLPFLTLVTCCDYEGSWLLVGSCVPVELSCAHILANITDAGLGRWLPRARGCAPTSSSSFARRLMNHHLCSVTLPVQVRLCVCICCVLRKGCPVPGTLLLSMCMSTPPGSSRPRHPLEFLRPHSCDVRVSNLFCSPDNGVERAAASVSVMPVSDYSTVVPTYSRTRHCWTALLCLVAHGI